MKLSMEVGVGPDHIVLDGDPAPLPQRGTAPQFWPMSVLAKRMDDQDATWWERRRRPTRHGVRWGPYSPSPKRGHSSPPLFGPCLL